MKNKLIDLNDHLFAQLERLLDESLREGAMLPGEEKAIQEVVLAGTVHGFGNLITRLRYAWVLTLKKDGVSWRSAALGALCTPEQVRFFEEAAEKDEAQLVEFLKGFTGRVV